MFFIEARSSFATAYLHYCPHTTTGCERLKVWFSFIISIPMFAKRLSWSPKATDVTNKVDPLYCSTVDYKSMIKSWLKHSIHSSNYDQLVCLNQFFLLTNLQYLLQNQFYLIKASLAPRFPSKVFSFAINSKPYTAANQFSKHVSSSSISFLKIKID